MKKIITKKVYRVTLECTAISKWAHEDGIAFGLKQMDGTFYMMMEILRKQKRNPWSDVPSKSRKVKIELIKQA